MYVSYVSMYTVHIQWQCNCGIYASILAATVVSFILGYLFQLKNEVMLLWGRGGGQTSNLSLNRKCLCGVCVMFLSHLPSWENCMRGEGQRQCSIVSLIWNYHTIAYIRIPKIMIDFSKWLWFFFPAHANFLGGPKHTQAPPLLDLGGPRPPRPPRFLRHWLYWRSIVGHAPQGC
jgi:hypothetical protein